MPARRDTAASTLVGERLIAASPRARRKPSPKPLPEIFDKHQVHFTVVELGE